ncbi:hypothetical protein E8E14_000401 [Neopestalotiopsis sp. 37M]|nr:hypothetical protein E8E14_000401 [Neopestalotiopsis sp. 37M]
MSEQSHAPSDLHQDAKVKSGDVAEQSTTASNPAANASKPGATLTTPDDNQSPPNDEAASDNPVPIASSSREMPSSTRNVASTSHIKPPADGVSRNKSQGRLSSPPEETARRAPSVLSSDTSSDVKLINAILTKSKDRTQDCLAQGAKVNKDVGFGFGTALHIACRFADDEIVKILLDEGASINERNRNGDTPLMEACRRRTYELSTTQNVVQLLLESGNDSGINSANKHQSTALTIACQHSSAEIVEKLLKGGAETDIADDDGDTPLILAARHGTEQMVGHILSRCPEKQLGKPRKIDRANKAGVNAIQSAILNSNVEEGVAIYKVLSLRPEFKVDELKIDWAQRLLCVASEAGNEAMVDQLLDGRVKDIGAQDSRGYTALQLACRQGHMGIAKKLLQKRENSDVVRDLPEQSPWAMFVQFCVESWESPGPQQKHEAFKDGASRIMDYVGLDEKIFSLILVNKFEDLEKLVSLMSDDATDRQLYTLIGLSARFRTETEHREALQRELAENAPYYLGDLQPTTPLQWCAFLGKRRLVWAMLRSPLSSEDQDPDDRFKSIKIVDHFLKEMEKFQQEIAELLQKHMEPNQNSSDGSKNPRSDYEIIKELLENPPVIVGVPNATYRVPSLEGPKYSLQKEEAQRQNATILDLYYCHDRTEPLRRSRPVYEVVHARNPDARSASASLEDPTETMSTKQPRKSDNDLHEGVVIHLPYITFGYCDRDTKTLTRGNIVRDVKRAAGSVPKQQPPRGDELLISRSTPQDFEAGEGIRSSRVPVETDKALTHNVDGPAMSLDEFYYNFGDMEKRNENQVVTRCFLMDKKRNKRRTDIGETDNRKSFHEEGPKRQIRNGDGVPGDYTKWPYLMVGQLWLWVIDEKTIITSSSQRQEGFVDPIMEKVYQQIRRAQVGESGQTQSLSVQAMSELLVDLCVGFIKNMTWNESTEKDDDWHRDDAGTASKSVLKLFAESLNEVTASERRLFEDFKSRMAAEQASNASKNQSFFRGILKSFRGTGRQGRPSTLTEQRTDGNGEMASAPDADTEHSKVIQTTAELLDEVKDILEELTILKVLLKQQQDVWERLVGQEAKDNKARGPSVIINDLGEMINRSNAIHQSASL